MHVWGSQLFIYTNDCAMHLLFMLSVGLSSWSDADRGKRGADGNGSLILPRRTPETDFAVQESSSAI